MRNIEIKGIQTHNLKNIDVCLERGKLIVVSGVSGSGKSSLAFDTIFSEGQRRFLECMSSSARSLLERLPKAHVAEVIGLPPTIALKQRNATLTSRSTVGTITEIDHYLRLLFTQVGVPYCPRDDTALSKSTISEIVDNTMILSMGAAIFILAPYTGSYDYTNVREYLESMITMGYTRYEINGEITVLTEAPREIEFEYASLKSLYVVVDRLIVKSDSRDRLASSVATALRLSERVLIRERDTTAEYSYTDKFGCPKCGFSIGSIDVGMFSPRTDKGKCTACGGLGKEKTWDLDRIFPNSELSINDGAIVGWSTPRQEAFERLRAFSINEGFSLDTKFSDLPEEIKRAIIYGSKDFSGVLADLDQIYELAPIAVQKIMQARIMKEVPCHVCSGTGACEAARIVKIGDGDNRKTIGEIERLPLEKAREYLGKLEFNHRSQAIVSQIMPGVIDRLNCLCDLGVGYLSLDRTGPTLSGGETQRIQLASHVGGTMSGILYVLDEPSIGLHPQDTLNMINALKHLRDNGNTVLVVEHDLSIIKNADYVLEIGPGAGENGGKLICEGTPEEISKNEESLTGQFLSGKRKVIRQDKRTIRQVQDNSQEWITLTGAVGRNLKNVTLEVPVGKITVVTGSSGSGKTSLVMGTLLPVLAQRFNASTKRGLEYSDISTPNITKVVNVDQSPIGKTPRSNPATYTRLFDGIRAIFANTQMSRERGYDAKHFSFNVKGGRCEICEGAGVNRVSMDFLPDVFVECEACRGQRYNRETLEVRYKGLNISEVLNLTVDEAVSYLEGHTNLVHILECLQKVGLGYMKLGQNSMEFSGGEAQRIKLAAELCRGNVGNIVFLLDEPTTGLHLADIDKLLRTLREIADKGNTVIIIEHNCDVIRASDWVIDMGPKGGDEGGQIVAKGFWKDLIKDKKSVTGKYLLDAS